MVIQKKKYYLLTIIILSSLLFSCKKENDNPVSPNNPFINGTLIPLAVGNQWVYSDSTITTSYDFYGKATIDLFVTIDSVSITSQSIYNNDTFYNTHNGPSIVILPTTIFERNDSLYRAEVYSNAGYQIVLYPVYFVPPLQGEIEYGNYYFASIQEKYLHTSVGDFNKYYLYAQKGGDSIYVVPKIGVVRKVTHYTSTRLYGGYKRDVINLIRYKIR